MRDLLRAGDWMAKVDLKNAHFMLPIREEESFTQILPEKRHLPVQVPAIRPSMCPMGLHQDLESCRCPAETTGNATDHLHRQHPNPGRVLGTGLGPCDRPGIYLLEHLAFAVSKAKCQLEPTHTIEFLGFTVSSLSQELSLPNGKINKIRAETRTLLGNRQMSI